MSPVAVATLLVLLAVLVPAPVRGHAQMFEPTPRQPEPLYWYQVGCMIGCDCSGGGKETYPSLTSVGCTKPASPTHPDGLTWNLQGQSPMKEWNKYMPFRAPGTARPIDACGIASGFLPDAKVQYPHKFADGTKQGTKGTDLPAGKVTVWLPNSTVEAKFNMTVNHGGGYQYRVCAKTKKPTNDCFEDSPLAFASNKTTIIADGKTITLDAADVTTGVVPAGSTWRRLPIPACNCDLGDICRNTTFNSTSGQRGDTVAYTTDGSQKPHGKCTYGLQFNAPHLFDGSWPDGYGYYVDRLGSTNTNIKFSDACSKHKEGPRCNDDTATNCSWSASKGLCYQEKALGAATGCDKIKDKASCSTGGCTWYAPKNTCYKGKRRMQQQDDKGRWWVVDQLISPAVEGDYILQWRWDNEQTPQVWTTCADIRVAGPLATKAALGMRAGGMGTMVTLLMAAATILM